MLINPKRNIFRVCIATDPDAASSLTAAQINLLGFTLAVGASGLVPYCPIQFAGPYTRLVETPAASPGSVSMTYTRLAGPIDVPLAVAVSQLLRGFAYMVEMPDPFTGKPVWQAGSIAGEVNIPSATFASYPGTSVTNPSYPSIALLPGVWIAE